MKIAPLVILLILCTGLAQCQPVSKENAKAGPAGKYLFYLHGAIIQDQGVNAVSKDFGPYKYLDIVDSLGKKGFTVFSEARPKNTDPDEYAVKVVHQVDSLVNSGVAGSAITIVGASAGAYITMTVAEKLQNPEIHFVVMGMCWPDTDKEFKGKKLCGKFLSIYEKSDPHGSCKKVFENRNCKGRFKEIELQMGNSHGFIYQPYKEWIDPVVEWTKE